MEGAQNGAVPLVFMAFLPLFLAEALEYPIGLMLYWSGFEIGNLSVGI